MPLLQLGPPQVVGPRNAHGERLSFGSVVDCCQLPVALLPHTKLASRRLAARPPPAVLDGGGSTLGFGDDDELLERASAVLKSQGPENWSRGRPDQETL